jgi:hypothetical protein
MAPALAYRHPDVGRSLEAEEARRAEDAEARRVVAAMKNPWHGIRRAMPRDVELAALLAPIGGMAVALLTVLFLALLRTLRGPSAEGWSETARVVASCAIFLGGSLSGVAGVGLGIVGLLRQRFPFASLSAIALGLCAVPWCFVCSVAIAFGGG